MSKYIDEYRNSDIAQKLGEILKSYKGDKVTLMEVCGTHTMAIFKFGIRELLSQDIRLISGPGCPVCVTPGYYINSAIELAGIENVIITTFGDMMRVPGSNSSLLKEKAEGRDIRIVYSPLDSLRIASENPDKRIVFLSIGFETTTPVIALSILNAKDNGIKNYSALTANKTIPEALKLLADDKDIGVNGFLYPGNVSAIIGTGCYEELAKEYKIPGVVSGFEPLDIMQSIINLVSNINRKKYIVENLYSRVVTNEGNRIAQDKMNEIFEPADADWRGIGNIKDSGMKIRDKYSEYDAWKVFGLKPGNAAEPKGCLCGEVLKGKKTPGDCALFNKVCTPEHPVGACMVSTEGTCAAYFKYGGL